MHNPTLSLNTIGIYQNQNNWGYKALETQTSFFGGVFLQKIWRMSSCVCVTPKPLMFIGECKGKVLPKRFKIIRNGGGVTAAPRSSETLKFQTLSKQGIALGHLKVEEIVERQSEGNHFLREEGCKRKMKFQASFLEEAYESCRKICAEYAKTFYLGTLLMTKERQRAIWAIYGKAKKKGKK